MSTKDLGPLGRRLKLLVAPWAPLTNPCAVEDGGTLVPTKRCPLPGIANEALHYLLEMSRLPYDIVRADANPSWGWVANNRTCESTGILEEIRNGTFDTLALEYILSEERQLCFEFLNPTVYSDNVLIYKATSDPSTKLTALLKVYSPGIWGLTLVIVTLLSLLMTINAKLFALEKEEKEKSLFQHLSESVWFNLSFVSDQASTVPKTFSAQTSSARFILAILGIFAIFFLKLYEGGLVTSLLAPATVRPFKNVYELADLVAAGEAEYVIEGTGYFEESLYDTRVTAMNAMRQAMQTTPVVFAASNAAGLRYVQEADPGEAGFMAPLVAIEEGLNLDCRLRYHYDDNLPSFRMAFAFVKENRRLIRLLNRNINLAMRHTRYMNRKYIKGASNRGCVAGEAAYLGLGNLLGLFILSGGLIGAAIVAFLWEIRPKNRIAEKQKDGAMPVEKLFKPSTKMYPFTDK